jgi:enamine deaminase RidA (YjgF/YER057c/UK114 family)
MSSAALSGTSTLAPRINLLGSRINLANVLPLSEDGALVREPDIRKQTHAVFRTLQRALRSAGAELADLVRINTCYVYDGPDESATSYWEKMTEVRLQYFPDPGPVGTAIRVAGSCAPGAIIQLEAEALAPGLRATRRRIMPEDRWDWSVPLPLSQGWRQGDYVWVGGQISADRRGRAVHKGDLRSQTKAVMGHIFSVLKDGGARPDDLMHLKVCYLHDGDNAAAEARLAQIMDVVRSACGPSLPPITAFGVNLLYEGLLLEIDAYAAVGPDRKRYLQVGGQSAGLPAASLDEKIRASLQQCKDAVKALGGADDNIVRMSLLLSKKAVGSRQASEAHRIIESLWPPAALPATSIVVVEGLPSGADVQADAFGMLR